MRGIRPCGKFAAVNPSPVRSRSINIKNAVMKAYETKSLKEIADSTVVALEGITAADAEHLRAAFNIKTIRDLAKWKCVLWAQAIVTLAETEQ